MAIGAYTWKVDFERARDEMVERQIVARGIRDRRVLDAMRAIPRHQFVPEPVRHHAYDDRALPIPEGQTISQPYIVAVMTETLGVAPEHRVLEIGTGSGYQAAILSLLARDVFSVERHPELAALASRTLASLDIGNVTIEVGDGSEGLPPHGPFDRILVTAGAPAVPETLLEQLGYQGRLVIPVGPPGHQHLTAVTRTDGGFQSRESEACVFVPLIGRYGWPAAH